jgi:hypothetical protein
MKKLILSAALALCTGAALAQTDQAQTSVGQPTDTNEPVYKGCLTGVKNNYTLTTVDGKTFRLHSDKDIDDHLNKNVEVRGSIKTEGGDHSAVAKSEGVQQEIDVADVKTVNDEACVAAKSSNEGASATSGMSAGATSVQNSTAGSTTAVGGTEATASTLPQGDQTRTDVGGATDTNEPLFKGCVSGTHDNYILTAENGDTFRLHSDKDINEHVGDRVEIRGTLKPEGDRKVSASSGMKGELDVADIKTVADGACKQ